MRIWTALALLLGALFLGVGLTSTSSAAGPTPAVRSSAVTETRGTIDYLRTIDTDQIVQFAKPRSMWDKVLEWVAGPAERPWFARPYALTEDSLGRLIVTDSTQGVVHILDFERRKYFQISKAGGEHLLSPVGVAVDAADNIYVSDSMRARIYVFNRVGKFLRALGESDRKILFKRPTGLAIDAVRGVLYVTDTLRHQVLVLDLRGNPQRAIGRRGAGPGEFNFPTALTLADGNLYVVDAMNFRVQILSPEGSFVRSFGALGNRSGMLNRPKGISVDSDGNVYLFDALFDTVQVFDSEGRLLIYFGKTGAGPGEFVLPSGIYVNPYGRIFVADSENGRVQVFRYQRVEH